MTKNSHPVPGYGTRVSAGSPTGHRRTAQGRHGRPWRTAKAKIYATESSCWLCGAHVDQTLRQPHPYSRSVDHLVQLQHGGDPLDRGNLHLAHRRCNVIRSNRLRGLPQQLCACNRGPGHPCARLDRPPPPRQPPDAPYLSVDPRTI